MENHLNPDCVVKEPLINTVDTGTGNLKIYKRRWYILCLFTCTGGLYNLFWNTWAPIQAPSRAVFGWDDRDILLLSLWAGAAFILATPPFIWLMDTKGDRR